MKVTEEKLEISGVKGSQVGGQVGGQVSGAIGLAAIARELGSISDLMASTPEMNTERLMLHFGMITEHLQNTFGKEFGKEFGKGSGKSSGKEISTWNIVLGLIALYPEITAEEAGKIVGISSRATEKHIKELKDLGIIERIGGRKEGFWQIIKHL